MWASVMAVPWVPSLPAGCLSRKVFCVLPVFVPVVNLLKMVSPQREQLELTLQSKREEEYGGKRRHTDVCMPTATLPSTCPSH